MWKSAYVGVYQLLSKVVAHEILYHRTRTLWGCETLYIKYCLASDVGQVMSLYLMPTGTCWWRSVSVSALPIFGCTVTLTYWANVHSMDMQSFAVFWNLVISLNKQNMTINLVWCQLVFPLQHGAFLEEVIIVCTGHRIYSCKLKDFEVCSSS